MRLDSGNAVRWDHPLNRSLVSWWLALPDQQRGVMFRDLCMRNHGTLTNGPVWSGSGLTFTAASSHVVNVGNPTSLNFSGSGLTLAALYRHTASADGHLMGKVTATFSYSLAVTQSNQSWDFIVNTSGGVGVHSKPGGGLALNPYLDRDVLVIAVYDGANLYLYADGKQVGTATAHTGTLVANGDDFSIGARGGNGNNGFTGTLRGAWVWGRALSATEARVLNAEVFQGYPSLLNWHRPRYYVAQDEGGGGATVPLFWHHYRQMMAG